MSDLGHLAAEAEQNDPIGTSMRWANKTAEEREEILAAATTWRAGLQGSLERAGYRTPDEYLAAVAALNGHGSELPPDELAPIEGLAVAPPGMPSPGRNGHADHALEDAPSERKLLRCFRTARELAAELPPEVPWLVWCYIALGCLHELVGRAKAAGKTTLIAWLIRALVDGLPFLGQPTIRTPVVLLTEQPPTSLRAALERAGLTDRDDLSILTWRDARGAAWRSVVAAAVAECRRIGARVLIVDTLPAFAGIRGDAENDAGAALAAVEPLQAAAADGLAVIVVRHERKGGGDVGESGRGSSAFTGSVDVVLQLRRQVNPVRPTVRVLSALSRFDETPDELVIELTDSGYVVLGDQTAVAFAEARAAILDVLPDSFLPDGRGAAAESYGLTVPEIVAKVDGRRTSVQAALGSLQDAGEVERVGSGRRGDPHRYRRTSPGFLSAGRSPLRGEPSPATSGREETTPAASLSELSLIVEAEPSVTVQCSDFAAHQPGHRRARDGWVCDDCQAAGFFA